MPRDRLYEAPSMHYPDEFVPELETSEIEQGRKAVVLKKPAVLC